jgi:Fe-S oxidoreductase
MKPATGSIESCLQNEPAFCTAACPFHLDVRDLIEKIERKSFNTAYRTYLNAVGFPGIVSALCGEPCKGVCPRKDAGGAISLRLLEKAVIDNARNLDPYSYNVPPKDKRVAVIGAGISGLACALRLASRKYSVTVFERTGRIGGHLSGLLPAEAYLSDIERQFMHETYELCLDTDIKRLDDLRFDAIYVATGAGGAKFGLSANPAGAFASSRAGIFLGGSLMGAGTMQAIADGLRVSTAMERYIKTSGMNQPHERTGTELQIDLSRSDPVATVLPSNQQSFSPEEAVAEAGRCLKCSCDACIRSCALMEYFRKYPKRIAEEVASTVQPGSLDGNATIATRLISTCSHCGLCQKVCPKGIDVGDLLLRGHRAMREKGAMPWAFHDFYLRDMAFANSEAGLFRLPSGHAKSRYLFFPGCQLGASDPRYITESYRFLLKSLPDTALALACCSAPAEWAGDEGIRDRANAVIRDKWREFGKPVAVFACPTCKQMFQKHLPEIDGVFLYDLLLERQINIPHAFSGEKAAVFDPCASREEPKVRQTIRRLAQRAGFDLRPLPMEGEYAQCCSWGGQVAVAHPSYAKHVVKQRTAQSQDPYIAYCSNCRDLFAADGKPVWHILDILFGLSGPNRMPPTVTARRMNRIALKRRLLEEYWEEEQEVKTNPIKISLTPELRQKLSDDLILESDIVKVIEHCENSGKKIVDPKSGSLSGHLKIGNMTFWAEYKKKADGPFELINAYAHRMSIEEAE